MESGEKRVPGLERQSTKISTVELPVSCSDYSIFPGEKVLLCKPERSSEIELLVAVVVEEEEK